MLSPRELLRSLLRSAGIEVTRYRKDGPMGTFFAALVNRGFCPSAIIDVGANRGSWTLLAAKYFTDAHFLMIEPQAEMAPALEDVKQRLGRADWISAGAGATAGKLSLTVHEDSVHTSFLGRCPYPTADSPKERVVDVVTLDEVAAKHLPTCPQLIKIDTEGFELEVLRGAGSLLGKVEVFVLEAALVRMWDRAPILREIIEWMAKHEYELFELVGRISGRQGDLVNQVDVAFAKREGSVFGDWQKSCN